MPFGEAKATLIAELRRNLGNWAGWGGSDPVPRRPSEAGDRDRAGHPRPARPRAEHHRGRSGRPVSRAQAGCDWPGPRHRRADDRPDDQGRAVPAIDGQLRRTAGACSCASSRPARSASGTGTPRPQSASCACWRAPSAMPARSRNSPLAARLPEGCAGFT